MKEELLKRLDALADKLGVAANKLLDIYVQQAGIEARIDLFWTVLLVVLALVCIGLLVVSAKKGDVWFPGVVIGFCGAIFMICIAYTCATSAIREYYNPQYWALQHIAEDLKK